MNIYEHCPFCNPDETKVIYRDDLVVVLWDKFPVSECHALIVPRRHVADWFEASIAEQQALIATLEIAKQEIRKKCDPDGFNIGVNVGAAAGQTVFHLHVHLIPRFLGDVPDPRGGVRYVIPHKANYLKPSLPELFNNLPHQNAVVAGGEDAFLPHLLTHLDQAVNVDLAISFILNSGVKLVIEHLRDLLARGGRLRLVTGDYMGVTDTQALRQLIDLQGNFDARVFVAEKISFHPKAYILHLNNGSSVAYVGSSNLSDSALCKGVEWNFRVINSQSQQSFLDVQSAFEALFRHPATRPISHDWIDEYEARRNTKLPVLAEVLPEEPEPLPTPHRIQLEALSALEKTRARGNYAGLVVLATGLGKTWLSAFDSHREEFRRVLFIAHREEILTQALNTYRRIRPNARLGLYTGTQKDFNADVLFSSVQTIARRNHLINFDADRFDYIIIDEFHHAAAKTYRRIIDHFEPKFLLGLTATPDRTDGGDLLALCQENLIYRCDVFEGIASELLCPFRYFGVPDDVDYENIPWRSTRFDEEALTQAVSTKARAENALEQWLDKAGTRTLGFCCSQKHANFMADYFRNNGVKAVAVHSGEFSAPRARSLEMLEQGDLEVVFSVDMFNEGVDVPLIDTVMMLRPTESNILWLQQFGRGLRKAEGKEHLTVIDYIGNHRVFLNKPRALFGLGPSDREIYHALNAVKSGSTQLPPGCEITYELEAIDILSGLLRPPRSDETLQLYYEDFFERHGQRPTAVEVYHAGYEPRSSGFGSWVRFVKHMNVLSPKQDTVLGQVMGFLESLETTQMTKSFKMLTLLAMLNADALPGRLPLDSLAQGFAYLARRSSVLQADVGEALNDQQRLKKLLIENPIAAFVGARGMGGREYFTCDAEFFATSSVLEIQKDLREEFQELVREIVDWRLAQYLDRSSLTNLNQEIVCKVSHSGGQPILFLPAREDDANIPFGWIPVWVEGKEYSANFVKIAVNVIKNTESDENVLPALIRQWFGPDAGLPGTRFEVIFKAVKDGYELTPRQVVRSRPARELWLQYSREEIPPQFGLEFNTGLWRQGFVIKGEHVFLLVTLEKDDLQEDHRYEDKFLSPELFQWESQNQTQQSSKAGQIIKNHRSMQYEIHLFVRRSKRSAGGRASAFFYCGELDFLEWEGEKPIRVQWQLRNPVPERLWKILKVPNQ